MKEKIEVNWDEMKREDGSIDLGKAAVGIARKLHERREGAAPSAHMKLVSRFAAEFLDDLESVQKITSPEVAALAIVQALSI